MKKSFLRSLASKIATLYKSDFLSIILSSTLVKIVSFISAMFLPRIIADKQAYGLLSYVDNIRSYILMFNGMGIMYAIIKVCAKEQNVQRRWGYFLSIEKYGLLIDCAIVAVTIVGSLLLPETFVGQKKMVIISAASPIFFLCFEGLQLYLRACFKNREYSILNFSYSALTVVLQIIAALVAGVIGVLIGRYIAVALSILLGAILVVRTKISSSKPIMPSGAEMRRIMFFGFTMLLSNATSTVMSLNETQMIAHMTSSETVVADYKIASYMFMMSTFLSQSIAIYIFPLFSRHEKERQWVWRSYIKVMICNGLAMIVIHALLWLIAEPFTIIAFGNDYIGAIPYMKALLIASFGQTTFRMLTGNVLAATGGERFNLIVNCVSIGIHFCATYLGISILGPIGVVVGPIAIYYLTPIPMVIYLKRKCSSTKTNEMKE